MKKGPCWDQVSRKSDHGIEERKYESLGYFPRSSGKSFHLLKCPFCLGEVQAYAWSIRASGKRCDCGALMGSLGSAYHFQAGRANG